MSMPERHETAAEDRIPWSQLIAYGMGGIIPIAIFNIAGQLIGLLGNISLGLSAFWLGTIMIIPRLWDALADPVIGHLSDNARTPWGRRRPFILIGGIATAVTFVAMWWVPRSESFKSLFPSTAAYSWFQLAYILVGLLVFFTSTTIFEIPHGALGMEMSGDYHERTRLFSAKSFLGNLFAMGTPWLIFLAGLDFFRGPGGDLTEGMRYVSMFIAAALVPMTVWWFVALKEPGFAVAKEQHKSSFWKDMRATISNRTFMSLVVIIFTLAMGFNFVALFNYYITIFYIFGGNEVTAGKLLGINGTAWAITGLVAVFPLNWLSKNLGKNHTLLISILLMCAAQLSKIVCYNPDHPYLLLIPTILLSSGMLMFFTLGSSMVGDICDEDELRTGTRSEGSFYAVFWWFIKMGSAFASFVTGVLLVFTTFDAQQNVAVDALNGNVAAIKADFKAGVDQKKLAERLDKSTEMVDKLRQHLEERLASYPSQAEHIAFLIDRANAVRAEVATLRAKHADKTPGPEEVTSEIEPLLEKVALLKQQSPHTLFRLRFVEIGTPLLLSVLSIYLTLRYPLTEARCYEIKELLKQRHAEREETKA
ncbi:MAG TPA: MFS transporter [Lacipirellulaceae bacterium]|jgi:GPH family glycoside/pentoside/hexuronide:cation symporter|nr:MFS transporter [Lacipirellulaceae bacterium]